jgi:hypothetical protein
MFSAVGWICVEEAEYRDEFGDSTPHVSRGIPDRAGRAGLVGVYAPFNAAVWTAT